MAGIPKTLSFGKETIEQAQSAGSFDAIPNGNYAATIFSIKAGEFGDPKPGKGNNKGKPFWNVQYRISDGQYTNRRLFQMVGLFEKWASPDNPEPNEDGAVNFTLPQFLTAIGVDLDEEVKLPSVDEIQGTEVTINVGTREYNGTKQNEIKRVNPKGGATQSAKVAAPKPQATEDMTL